MTGATTTLANISEIMDRIKGNVCVFPDEFMAPYIGDVKEHDVKLCGVLERIAKSLELGEAERKRHFAEMEAKMDEVIRVQNDNSAYLAISVKLDKLIESVSNISTLLQSNLAKDDRFATTTQLKKNISKVKNLRGQFLRTEKMSNYTEELLCMDPPFVQRKFRVKVSRDTPTDEIESYQD